MGRHLAAGIIALLLTAGFAAGAVAFHHATTTKYRNVQGAAIPVHIKPGALPTLDQVIEQRYQRHRIVRVPYSVKASWGDPLAVAFAVLAVGALLAAGSQLVRLGQVAQ
jgi:hypothetical protein